MSGEDEPKIPDKMFFRIGELAELVGVEAHVLRYWESEFRVRPQRSPSGQRMYRRRDILRFLRIKQLLYTDGYTIAGAKKTLSAGNGGTAGEPGAMNDAVERLQAVRARIAKARERFARMIDAGDG